MNNQVVIECYGRDVIHGDFSIGNASVKYYYI